MEYELELNFMYEFTWRDDQQMKTYWGTDLEFVVTLSNEVKLEKVSIIQ